MGLANKLDSCHVIPIFFPEQKKTPAQFLRTVKYQMTGVDKTQTSYIFFVLYITKLFAMKLPQMTTVFFSEYLVAR